MTIIRLRPLVLALQLAVVGCSSDPVRLGPDPMPLETSADLRAEVGESFTLGPGEFAAVEGRELLVAFRLVRSDSRCPRDVQCVWQGDAEAEIGIASDGGEWAWSVLHTGVEPRAVPVVEGLILNLLDVNPDPISTTSIPARDYRVILAVTEE